MQTRPHFFIVGAPKCGTTSMAEYLNRHPDVFVMRGEPHHFGTDLDYNKPRLSREQYLKLAAGTGGKRLCGDRSTWYLYSERAAGEIHDHNPDARIIAMLRNPADMIRSLHRHQFQRGRRDDLEGLADALDAEPDRRRGLRIPPDARFPESLFYSAIPRYSAQLRRFFETFGRDRVHVILFDDLRRDPAATYRETLEFLGVDSSFEPDFAVHNVAAPTPDSLLYRAWKASTLRYRLRGIVPQRIYTAIRERRRRRNAAAPQRESGKRMPPEIRERLDARFADEIDRLEDLLDRDLGSWRATASREAE